MKSKENRDTQKNKHLTLPYNYRYILSILKIITQHFLENSIKTLKRIFKKIEYPKSKKMSVKKEEERFIFFYWLAFCYLLI